MKQDKKSLKQHLKDINSILQWFEAQEELDVEEALEKIKKASDLIKESRERLTDVENEFKEIKKDIEE